MRVRLTALVLTLLLTSCGYHLVGQDSGRGAIPKDVSTISMRAEGALARSLATGLKHRLETGDRYTFIGEKEQRDESTHAEIGIDQVSESFVASAYDQAGVAAQYRMNLKARVRIFRSGQAVWNGGLLSMAGDVFVAGGPAGIEASRERIRNDLKREWIQEASDRIRSGF